MTCTDNNYYIQVKLNIMKLKPGLWAFYAMRPLNGSGLFYSCPGMHDDADNDSHNICIHCVSKK